MKYRLVKESLFILFFSFNINSGSGQISTLRALDYEAKNQYTFTVTATDINAYPRQGFATVIVDVDDINDNTPRFTDTIYTGSFYENEPAGTSVTKVIVSILLLKTIHYSSRQVCRFFCFFQEKNLEISSDTRLADRSHGMWSLIFLE